MSSTVILVILLAAPYLALNLWRVAHGRTWAFTFCRVTKEWEEGQRITHASARGAARRGTHCAQRRRENPPALS